MFKTSLMKMDHWFATRNRSRAWSLTKFSYLNLTLASPSLILNFSLVKSSEQHESIFVACCRRIYSNTVMLNLFICNRRPEYATFAMVRTVLHKIPCTWISASWKFIIRLSYDIISWLRQLRATKVKFEGKWALQNQFPLKRNVLIDIIHKLVFTVSHCCKKMNCTQKDEASKLKLNKTLIRPSVI